MQKAKLWYFVDTTNLVYRDDITGKWIYLQAMSGGGRGQRIGNAVLPYGVNNSRLFSSISEREKHVGSHRGGPIPKGIYDVGVPKHHNFRTAQSPKIVYAAELKPRPGNGMYDRDEFFIHGQGQLGSDGCIVPTYGKVQQVFNLLSKHHGGVLSKPPRGTVSIMTNTSA
jgi:hypothetical protein